jgi:hypothetical protein
MWAAVRTTLAHVAVPAEDLVATGIAEFPQKSRQRCASDVRPHGPSIRPTTASNVVEGQERELGFSTARTPTAVALQSFSANLLVVAAMNLSTRSWILWLLTPILPALCAEDVIAVSVPATHGAQARRSTSLIALGVSLGSRVLKRGGRMSCSTRRAQFVPNFGARLATVWTQAVLQSLPIERRPRCHNIDLRMEIRSPIEV